VIVTIHWRNTVLKPPAFFWVTTQGGEIKNPLLEDHHGDSGHEISPFFWVDLITTEAVVLPKPVLSWFRLFREIIPFYGPTMQVSEIL
jgi:hypothetical protein